MLPTSTAAATVGTLVLLGTFYAATDGVIAAVAGRLVPVQARSSGIAAAQTVVALARMLASAGFGLLWLLLGPTVGDGVRWPRCWCSRSSSRRPGWARLDGAVTTAA